MSAPYQHILVPIDGSDTSSFGLDEAIRLARVTGGQVRLFHVVDDLSFSMAVDAYAGQAGDWIQTLREAGTRLLESARAKAAQAGVQVEVVLHEGFDARLADAVAAQAQQWPADLIVLGTHGRRGIGRVVMGSGAESILRAAPVPTLLVRPPQSEDRARTGGDDEKVHVSTPTSGLRFEHLE
ncbi:universal stress protein [Variovorax sp.]|uniref:universal stress protein n=1 Tax=Variovorax sp. TaxID=1871043 RepID=UPI002D2E8059|nr:universal stress protein [Variovorax sp.]HYP85881.1 universal stress protein [Variovorax sp.]